MPATLRRIADKIRNSLVIKAFGVCFLAVHMPLLALLGYLLFAAEPTFGPVVIVCLAATLAGTVFAIRTFHKLLDPLNRISLALAAYGNRAEILPLEIPRGDEVGQIARGVETLISRLEETLGGLRRQAMTDPLTGIGNRRWLMEEVNAIFARAIRERTMVSVCLFDLDHFKHINDRHGHEVGDIVLMTVAEVTRMKLRPYDLFARWGGEEFCVVIGSLPEAHVANLAERLRRAIETTPAGPLAAGVVTASFGIASGSAETCDFASLLRAADTALYDAKAAGRNRVAAAPHTAHAAE